MKIKGILAGLAASSIAGMMTAAITASALAPAAAPAAEKIARANTMAPMRNYVSHDITSGIPDYKKASSLTSAVTGEIPLMILVVGFNNADYTTDTDWANLIFDGEYSLSQYYTDQSCGKFTFTPVEETCEFDDDLVTNTEDKANDGVVHITLDSDHENWTKLDTTESNVSMLTAYKSAIEQAGNYVDYAKYDKNGNGMIETDELSIGIIVAGNEASYTGNTDDEKGVWAHSWSFDWGVENELVDFPSVEGTEVNKYICMGEILDPDEGLTNGVSTLAHELGHYLGLLDYYDVDYNEEGEWLGYTPGRMSVMDGGSWGIDAEQTCYRPFSFDPLSKMILGWIDPEVVTEPGVYDLTAENYETAEEEGKYIIIPTANEGEYYIAEVRNNNKWDAGMTYFFPKKYNEGGVVLYHVDENVFTEPYPSDESATNADYNSINIPQHRPGVTTLNVEVTEDGKFTTIGDEVVYVEDGMGNATPINAFSKSLWEDDFGLSANMGEALELPQYGTGDNKDLRSGRTGSGIGVKFLDDNMATGTMQIEIVKPYTSPTTPTTSSSEPDSSSTVDSVSTVDPTYSSETSSANSSSKIDTTAVSNTGAGAGVGAAVAVIAGAIMTVAAKKRKEN